MIFLFQPGEGFSCFQRAGGGGFPGGAGFKNPPANAGDTGLSPGRGTKIPHVTEQLSLCATTTEPVL